MYNLLNNLLINLFFSPSTGYYCAIQSLEAIRDLHDLGYVHRDIKPGNFVIGLPRTQFQNIVYMVDFGIARKFIGADGRIRNPRDRVNMDYVHINVINFLNLDKIQRNSSFCISKYARRERSGQEG